MKEKIPTGYKKTEIGIIPEDWEVKRLGEVFELCSANSKTKYISNIGKYIIMDMGSVSPEGKIIKNKLTFLSEDILRKDDLVMPKDDIGEGLIIGKVAIIPENNKYILGDHVYRLRMKSKKHFPLFFYYLINSDKVNRQLKRKVTGSAQKGLSQKDVLEQELYFPPTLAEQKAIARILSYIDELIESIDKLIEKKKLIKKGAMQELLSGKKRLPGFKGEWVRKRLGEILKYEQPTKYIVKSTNYLEVGFIPVLTAGKTFILGYTDERDGIYKDVPAIIFDDFTTATKYVNFPFKVKSSALKILKCRNEEYDLKFIYEKMQMIDYQISEGNHKRRWIAEYQNIEITLPPTLAEQKAIAQILSDMDAEIEALERKKKKYEMIKKGMMELLLTGKVRVREENGEIKRIGGIDIGVSK